MSVPEFDCTAADHRCLLVLVQQVGSALLPRAFCRLYDRVARVAHVRIADAHPPRSVRVRYCRAYPADNNAWADFQPHRRLVGMISFGVGQQAEPLLQLHRDVWRRYPSTLFDSRLVLFGPSNDGDKDVAVDDSLGAVQLTDTGGATNGGAESVQVIRYPSPDDCENLEEKLQEYIASLFWILESKRRERSLERQDRLPLLTAPFEKKDLFGLDVDSRTYRKRYQGRRHKHVADLCLLAGLPTDALTHYRSALDILPAVNDWLWVAAAYEGFCSTLVCQALSDEPKVTFQRNLSFSMKRGSSAMKEARGAEGSLAGGAAGGGGSNGAAGFVNGLTSCDVATATQRDGGACAALPRDIVDKYREAMSNYCKFKQAGVIEMEACLKACRVLITQQRFLTASDFLQNVVYILNDLSDDERVQRYSTMAALYATLGMQRKAAFYRRIAAMQSVADEDERASWLRCYHLLLDAFPGYKMAADPKAVPKGVACYGWPTLQLRLLHELIYSARKMGNPAIAVRHLSLLLSRLFDHLSPSERGGVAGALISYSRHAPASSSATSLVLDTGRILPPVPLLRVPTVTSFKPQCLPPHLRPVKLPSSSSNHLLTNGPFIYSPLQLDHRRERSGSKPDFLWVDGDECTVMAQLSNPLTVELKVSNMCLVTEDVAFVNSPVTMSLPAESGLTQVKLTGVPSEPGRLRITGYSACALGVQSQCRLTDVAAVAESYYVVRVTPALPSLRVSTSLRPADSFSDLADSDAVVSGVSVSMLAGQSMECEIRLRNVGKLAVEWIHVSLESRLNPELLARCIACNEQNVVSQLPLAAGAEASLTLYLTAAHQVALSAQSFSPSRPRPPPRHKRGAVARSTSSSTVLDALVKLQYSGGPGLAEHYCRRCAVAVTMEIEPSVLLTRWQVLASDSADHFRLILDVENTTFQDIQLDCPLINPVIIPRQKSDRLSLQLRRCSTTLILQEQGHRRDSLAALHSDASRHVNDLVDIQWAILSTGVKGKVSLESLTWAEHDLESIYRSPLRIDVWLQGRPHVAGEAVFIDCGVTVPFMCNIQNNSDAAVYNVHICVQCHVDSGSSSEPTHQVATTVVTIGNQSTTIDELPIGEDCGHACAFLFLHSGRYRLAISCSANLQPSVTSVSRLEAETHRFTWHYPAPVCLSADVS